MKSKTSSFKLFNKTLFLKNLTSCWPLWAFISFFGVINFTSFTFTIFDGYLSGKEAFARSLSGVVTLNPIIIFIYALFTGYFTWKFMFKSRTVNFMHSLPISRKSVYFTSILSGLTITLIPYLLSGLTVMTCALLKGNMYWPIFFTCLLVVICEAVLFFAIATFCAHITGSKVGMPILYIIFNFLVSVIDNLVRGYASGFLLGIEEDVNTFADFFSPVVALLQHVGDLSGETNYKMDNAWIAYIYGAVGLLIIVITYILYKRRKSESAGYVISEGFLRPVFKYGVAICSGLYFGNVLYSIIFLRSFFLEALFVYNQVFAYIPMIICTSVMGVIGYFVACMLLEKRFKVFNRKTLIGAGIVIAFFAVFCSVLRFDVFGFSKVIPEKSDIKSVEVSGNIRCTFYTGKDDEEIEEILKIHQAIIDNKDTILYLDDYEDSDDSLTTVAEEIIEYYSYEKNYENDYVNLQIIYNLKNGGTLEREYIFNAKQTGLYDLQGEIDAFFASPKAQLKALYLDDGSQEFFMTNIDINSPSNSDVVSGSAAREILDALEADIKSGADVFNSGDSDMYMFINYESRDKLGADSVCVNITPAAPITYKTLTTLGFK